MLRASRILARIPIRAYFITRRFKSDAIPFSKLRPYQEECIKTTLTEYKEGCHRQVVSLPVGSGKTVIMSNLIPLIPPPTPEATKVLLLAHRTELLDQAHNQIKRYNPQLVVHVEQGKRQVDLERADVIVASVPTLGRQNSARLSSYDPDLFKAVLIDEAHHATADTYIRILEHFGLDSAETDKLLWGCTATVKRHDGEALGQVFDRITYHVGFLEMIEKKYLSPMRVTIVDTKVDLSSVRTTQTDFVQKDLSLAVNTQARNEVIVSSWKKFAHEKGRKSTLAFAVDISHTIELCNAFIDAGIPAKCITSKSNAMERLEILDEFRSGKIPVLVNCAILTEGTDIPCVDCILLARPTRSATLFQQMFGRGLRLFPGKEDCLVIDFEDSFTEKGSAGLITVPTLLGLRGSEVIEDADVLDLEKQAVEEHEKLEAEKLALEEQEREENEQRGIYDPASVKIKVVEYDDLSELLVDLSVSPQTWSASSNGWVDVGNDRRVLSVPGKGYLVLERSNGIWTGSFRFANSSFFGKKFPIPLEAEDVSAAIRAADTWVRRKFPNLGEFAQHIMSRSARFRRHDATEAQIKALSRYKIQIPPYLSKGHAMDLITKLKFGQLSKWKKQYKQQKIERKKKTPLPAVISRQQDESLRKGEW